MSVQKVIVHAAIVAYIVQWRSLFFCSCTSGYKFLIKVWNCYWNPDFLACFVVVSRYDCTLWQYNIIIQGAWIDWYTKGRRQKISGSFGWWGRCKNTIKLINLCALPYLVEYMIQAHSDCVLWLGLIEVGEGRILLTNLFNYSPYQVIQSKKKPHKRKW